MFIWMLIQDIPEVPSSYSKIERNFLVLLFFLIKFFYYFIFIVLFCVACPCFYVFLYVFLLILLFVLGFPGAWTLLYYKVCSCSSTVDVCLNDNLKSINYHDANEI